MPSQYIIANPVYLKSNMDRFIASCFICNRSVFWYLKSNMDRFIDKYNYNQFLLYSYLKSNMDRFIVVAAI